MTDTTDLIARLRDNAQGISLGAEGMGWGFDEAMLNEAADALEQHAAQDAINRSNIDRLAGIVNQQADEIEQQAAQIEALRADAERLRSALNFIAEHMCSDWSQRCQAMVNTARAALRQEQPT